MPFTFCFCLLKYKSNSKDCLRKWPFLYKKWHVLILTFYKNEILSFQCIIIITKVQKQPLIVLIKDMLKLYFIGWYVLAVVELSCYIYIFVFIPVLTLSYIKLAPRQPLSCIILLPSQPQSHYPDSMTTT